ncbi:hypothetical protein [Aestuariivirga litoralis]|uniref:hypothetical protein n=1 Tax=Aestuariivirga litoralis TaxID=2650924 RepID=UPI0018C48CCE|nr:hypothetical protein [Aestuariivirga litoralis]
MVSEIEVRFEEFRKTYQDFETSDLVGLVIKAGQFLELVTWEPDATRKAMNLLYHEIVGYDAPLESGWRENWLSAWSELGASKASDYFVDLNQFAFFGLCPDHVTRGDANTIGLTKNALARSIHSFVQRGRELLSSIPADWGENIELKRTVLAAEARIATDMGRPVSIEQLAALCRVGEKSIRNLLTPKTGDPDMKSNGGMIDAADAQRWLKKRGDYKSSIWWTTQNAIATEGQVEAAKGSGVLDEVVFVPVARDGSWFHPVECRNARGYTVGSKGSEAPIADYFEALKLLAKAPTPSWRRPNENGHWGIVAGYQWARKEASELHKLLDEGTAL